jgi:hypothetical protein
MKTEKGNLADQLEIWGIDSDFTIFTDGSLGFGLELTPIDMTALPDTALNSLSSHTVTRNNFRPTNRRAKPEVSHSLSIWGIAESNAGAKPTTLGFFPVTDSDFSSGLPCVSH